MEAVALFSYTASEADEISFQRGDVIKVSAGNAQGRRWTLGCVKLRVRQYVYFSQVTEMDEDSCWLTAEIQGKRGYVPENYISLLPYP